MRRACPSTPCSPASRRGRRDRSTPTRQSQRSLCARSANARSPRPTRAPRAFPTSSRSCSARPVASRPPRRPRSHHPRIRDPPPRANIQHRQGSNNPFSLAPRLSPTQSFRSRLPRRAQPSPVTAAEALLFVGRHAGSRVRRRRRRVSSLWGGARSGADPPPTPGSTEPSSQCPRSSAA